MGTTTTLAPAISGGKADLTYAWYKDDSETAISGANAATYTTPAADATDGATHTYTIKVTDQCGTMVTNSYTVNVYDALTVGNIAEQTICVNTTVTLAPAISGGKADLTYAWYKDDSETAISGANAATYTTPAADATDGATHTYKLVVTDACQNTANNSFTVNVYDELTVGVIAEQTICVGTTTTLAPAISGGKPTLTYAWYKDNSNEPIATTATYTTPAADATDGATHIYKFVVTDACQNVFERNYTVNVYDALTVGDIAEQTICVGTTTTLAPAISGGKPTHTYAWYKNGNVISGANAATYTTPAADAISGQSVTYKLMVTDACQNTVENSFVVSVAPALTVADIADTTVCVGTSATLTAVPSNGTAPYAYKWYKGNEEIDGATSATYTTPTADAVSGQSMTYKVVVTDACANTVAVEKTATVSVRNALDIAETHTNISCYGGDNGSITVTASNGNPGYQFKIDNESYSELSATTTATYNQLTAGTHTVTVKDNCGTEKSIEIELTEPAALAATITEQVDVNCYRGNDGAITVTATENTGTAPYTYKRKHVGDFSETNTFSGLVAGKDTIVVMDHNGCSVEVPFEITQPDTLELHEIADSHKDVTCHGEADGEIAVAATGGIGTYLYNWNNGGYGGNSAKDQLTAGNYTIVVKDGHQCTASVTVTITEPDELTATIEGTNISCYGETDGTITVSVSGGTEPYTYKWNDDTPQNRVAERTNLAAGEYTVTVTDDHYCTSVKNITLTQPDNFTVTVSGDVEICANETTTFTAETTGDIASLQWKRNGDNIENATSSTLSAVNTAGSYTVVATQTTTGCTVTSEAITLTVDTVPNVTITGPASVCDGNEFELIAHNADHYVWSDGTDPIEPEEEDVLIANGEDIEGSTTYHVTGTNSYGCTASASKTITVNALPSTDLTIFVNGEDFGATGEGDEVALCAGGSVTISVPNGEGNTYTWYDENEEELTTVTGNTLSMTNITESGTYWVIVTDANGCEGWTEPVYVSVVPLPDFTLSVNGETENISMCADGTVTIEASDEEYTYSWSGNYLSGNDNISRTFGPATDVTATSTYTISVTGSVTEDDYDLVCSTTQTIGITVNALPTVTLTSSPEANNGIVVLCDGQSATLTASSETNSFSWEKDRVSIEGSENTLEVDEEGKYTVSVTDNHGCSNASDTITVYVNPLPDFIFGVIVGEAESQENETEVCRGTEVTLMATQMQDAETYTYTWSTNDYLSTTGNTRTFSSTAPAGEYTISVTATSELTQCSNTLSRTIIVHELPTITVADNEVCLNGSVALNASGASNYVWTPTSYFVEPNTITDVVTGSSATFYGTEAGDKEITVTGTDDNGCVNTATATVTVRNLPTEGLTALENKEICQGATASWTIENGNYTSYEWSSDLEGSLGDNTTGNSITFTGSTTGTYSVTVEVTDNNGCTNSASANVVVDTLPIITLSSETAVCQNGDIIFTTTAATADNGIHGYVWTYPTANATVTGETDGNTLTVKWSDYGNKIVRVNYTDGHNCTATQPASKTIAVNELPNVIITNGEAATICLGETVNLSADGATDYVWANEAGNTADITVEPKRDSTFTVTGTDANGCSNTASIDFTVNDTVKLTISNNSQEICLGGAIDEIAITYEAATLNSITYCDGLSYDSETGKVTGTPTAAGTYNYTITATSNQTPSCGSKSENITIVVNDTVKFNATNLSQELCLGASINPIVFDTAHCTLNFDEMPDELSYNATDHQIEGRLTEAGTYNFTVTATNGCGTKTKNVSITMNDTVKLTVTNSTQELCLGTPITLIGIIASNGEVSINNLPTGLSNNSDNIAITGELTTAGTHTFTIQASSTTCPSTDKSVEVSITMLDTAKLTATNTTQTFCLGTPIAAIVLDTANCELDFGQMPTGLSYNETAHQIEGEILTAGVHNFTVTATSDCGEKSVDITITMNDTAHFEADNLTQTLCLGTNITPIVLDTAHCTLDFGSMSNELSYNAAAHQIEGRLTTAGTHEFTITATAGNNCGSKTQNVSITMNDTVKLVTLSRADDFSQEFCKGIAMTDLNFRITNSDNVELTGAPAGVTLAAVEAESETEPNYVMSGTPTATGTFNFTITASSEACEASVKTFNGTIIVDTIPAVTITTDADNNTICAGDAITLTATEGYEEYVWSNEEEDDIIEIEPDRTNYTVTVTNGKGCSNSATINITINELPTVTISEENNLSTICADSAFHFIVNCTTAVEYLWSDESEGSTLRATEAGEYFVAVTDANGCTNESNTLTVTVNPLPEVTTSHENVSCTELGSATITVTSEGTGFTCAWNGGAPAEMMIEADRPTTIIEELSEGIYTYVVTDGNNCSATGTVTIDNPGVITGTQTIANAYSCEGADNNITFTIEGGSPDYIVTWVNVDDEMPITGTEVSESDEPTSTFTFNMNDLSRGDYRIAMVIEDAYGCHGNATDTIELTIWPSYNIVREINIGTGINEYTYNGHTYATTEVPETEELETVHGCDSIISYVVNQYDLEILFADTCFLTRSSYAREYSNTPNELLGDTIYLAQNTPSYFYAYIDNTTNETWKDERVDMSYELQYSEQAISEDDMPNLVENFSISTYYDRLGVYMGIPNLTEPTGEIPSTTFAFRQTANSSIMQYDYFYFDAFKNIPNKVNFTGLENGTYTLKLKVELRNSVEETGIDRNGIYNPYIVKRKYGHILGGYGDTVGVKQVIAARNLTIIVNEDGVNPSGAPAAINEYSNEASVRTFPNPVNDQLNLVINGMEGNTQITITDAQGKVVRIINVELNGGTEVLTYNASDFAQGMYFLNVRNNETMVSQKFVVTRR